MNIGIILSNHKHSHSQNLDSPARLTYGAVIARRRLI